VYVPAVIKVLKSVEGSAPRAILTALVVYTPFVTVPALPVIAILHVPEAPPPVVDGTDKLVLAAAAVVAPVPPYRTAIALPFQTLPVLIVLFVKDCAWSVLTTTRCILPSPYENVPLKYPNLPEVFPEAVADSTGVSSVLFSIVCTPVVVTAAIPPIVVLECSAVVPLEDKVVKAPLLAVVAPTVPLILIL
jgi:hypothetical protein